MDSKHFDRLARSLHTRRKMLGGILGGGAVVAGWVAPEPAEGAPRRRRCPRRKKRCRGTCIAKTRCCTNANCPKGTICDRRGACICPAGLSKCGARCARGEGASCAGLPLTACCSGSCDSLVGGGTCSSCNGGQCGSNADCCPGTNCVQGFCGGCRHRAVVCVPGGQPCCNSECRPVSGSTGVCLSAAGGRCKHDVDCYNCYMHQQCDFACFQGFCLT